MPPAASTAALALHVRGDFVGNIPPADPGVPGVAVGVGVTGRLVGVGVADELPLCKISGR